MTERLGILGGTFDPLHNMHLFIAESARLLCNLDRVLFVPTGTVHHRSAALASAADRCAMVRAGIASNGHFALDETDLATGATGYTADLLPRLRERYPQAALTFVIGADSLTRSRWDRMDLVLEQLEAFVVAPRAGIAQRDVQTAVGELPAHLRERVRMLDLPESAESATLIRALLARGQSVRYLVPDPVWAYIIANRLYGAARET